MKLSMRAIKSAVIVLGLVLPMMASAISLPPRFYLKTLIGGEFIPILRIDTTGNVNPLDPGYLVDSDAEIDAEIVFAGYAKSFTAFGRAASMAYLQPMGEMSLETFGPPNAKSTASGFGDPFFEFNINLIGPDPQVLLSDLFRYQPGFSLDMIIDVSLPLGEYDEGEAINIGMNRYWGRLGFPLTLQLGEIWAPSQRATFELLPTVIWMGDNDGYGASGDQTQEVDTGYSLAGHLTFDVADNIWVSLDATYLKMGDSEVEGVTSDGSEFTSIGVTIGMQLTRNLFASIGYESTIDDEEPGDVQLSTFSASLTFFWADILEGLYRRGVIE